MEPYPENYTRQLERLLSITHNGEHIYQEAAEHAHTNDLKVLFEHYAKEREQIVNELQEHISSWGTSHHHRAADTESIFHRATNAMKTVFSKGNKDDQVLLESCRNSDLAALDIYDDVLQGSVLEISWLKAFLIKQRLKISEALNEIDRLYFARFKTNPEV